jgi:hypothetical protein
MKISKLFTSGSLAPAWHFTAAHTLWRLMFSHNGMIFGEDRDTEKKTATFFCIDAHNGKSRWQQKQFSDQWWIGLEGTVDKKLFLHGFKKPDMPEHKSIICVDAESGNELWRNDDCALFTCKGPYVFGYRDLFERRLYYKLRETDGMLIEELQTLPEDIDGSAPLEKNDFHFSQPYNDRDEQTGKIVLGLYKGKMEDIRSVEFIETAVYTVLNIHSVRSVTDRGVEDLTNTLFIAETQSGKKLYSDILNESTPYPVPDSFFIDPPMLYYIKERKTLTAVNLQ